MKNLKKSPLAKMSHEEMEKIIEEEKITYAQFNYRWFDEVMKRHYFVAFSEDGYLLSGYSYTL
jgi:hypothetical protein